MTHPDAQDLREGGRWTPLQRAKNDLLWALACAGLLVTAQIPPAVLARIGRAIGLGAYAVLGRARRTALDNVARVFPHLAVDERRAFVRRCFSTLGGLLGETTALLRTRAPPRVLPLAPQALAVIDEARAAGRGVVFASAHLGPWEHVAASLVAAGVPLLAVGRESYDPRFTRLYERLRGGKGVRTLWRAEPGAAARILRALRTGAVLGLPMDLASRGPSCPAPFLGHEASTPSGPARLALATRAAVVVGTAAPGADREGDGGFVVTATRIRSDDLRAKTPNDAAVRELTTRINEELSKRILAIPHAWVWMHGRWGDHGDFRGGEL
ncbi:MAG TPA: hypothetical protein VKU41_00405 [Polyangiaceae bacterium]|nr:hypothetical protein [Polyangiaceae bacterium]